MVADNLVSSGNISQYSGLTIATSTGSNLNIDGSVTYHTARQKSGGNYASENSDSNFTTHAGTLGIVSKTIEVVDKDAGGNNLTNVEVDGSVLAFDTFDATDTNSRTKGTFQSMGGYIANASGSFGNVYLNGTGERPGGELQLRRPPRHPPPPRLPDHRQPVHRGVLAARHHHAAIGRHGKGPRLHAGGAALLHVMPFGAIQEPGRVRWG